mgnify:CR=1 FL=1
MIISAHQPAYMPWLGYLDRIRRSDVFVFLDTVQFEKQLLLVQFGLPAGAEATR